MSKLNYFNKLLYNMQLLIVKLSHHLNHSGLSEGYYTMQYIRFGVFDVFGRVIPGLFGLVLVLLSTQNLNFDQLSGKISSLPALAWIVLIIFSYLIGFVLDTLGSYYQSFVGKLLFGDVKTRVLEKFKRENPEVKIEKYNIQLLDLAAEINSPRINERQDGFRAMGLMSRNLSLSLFIYALITLVIEILHFDSNHLIVTIIKVVIAVFLSYLLLLRALYIRQSGDEYLLYAYYFNRLDTKNQNLSKNGNQ